MAELIPKEEMATLKSAAEVKEIADKAIELQDIASAAHLINEAANTGQHMAVWGHPLTDELRKALEGQGYKVTKRAARYPDIDEWAITGF